MLWIEVHVEHLTLGAKDLQINIQPAQLDAFRIFQQELIAWNAQFNLTAIIDPQGIQVRHFLDSLSCVLALGPGERFSGKRVIDVGTGAGFPGLPLKILCPGIDLTLVDATEKKTAFLQHMVDTLHLDNVTVVHDRAELLGQNPRHREQYDWAFARAVAEMPVLSEYLLPLVAIGGRVLAQKGESAPAEVQRGEAAIKQLGGSVHKLVSVELRGVNETRYLVILNKNAVTPARYPRRPGMPRKRPL